VEWAKPVGVRSMEGLGVNAHLTSDALAHTQPERNSRPYLVAMALVSSEACRVGLPVSSMVTSAIIASKTPPGELMMI
jgi:hypothetical protein